jgi:MoaA/NifB/PqqE/SkfB family radical SAM enzyme
VRPHTTEHQDYRGYAGVPAAGTLKPGDEVVVLPSGLCTTIAGIDTVMALRPPHVDTGMNVTIVRGNVDHLLPLTALAIEKGFAKVNFQFTTPFGRAWEDVVPPLDEDVVGAAESAGHLLDALVREVRIRDRSLWLRQGVRNERFRERRKYSRLKLSSDHRSVRSKYFFT